MAKTYMCSICGTEHMNTMKAGLCCYDEKERKRWQSHMEDQREMTNQKTQREISEKRRQIREGE